MEKNIQYSLLVTERLTESKFRRKRLIAVTITFIITVYEVFLKAWDKNQKLMWL